MQQPTHKETNSKHQQQQRQRGNNDTAGHLGGFPPMNRMRKRLGNIFECAQRCSCASSFACAALPLGRQHGKHQTSNQTATATPTQQPNRNNNETHLKEQIVQQPSSSSNNTNNSKTKQQHHTTTTATTTAAPPWRHPFSVHWRSMRP